MRAYFLAFVMLAGPVMAETPLTVDEFEAIVTGKLIAHFDGSPTPFGVEEYLPDRHSRWAFTDDICIEGRYFQQGDWICFDYVQNPPIPLQCWHYYMNDGKMTARFKGDDATRPAFDLRETKEKLPCVGPDVGA